MKYTLRILRINQVTELTGLSPSTLNRLEKRGAFPRRRQIGIRAVGWLEREVHSWISESNQRFHCVSIERARAVSTVINSVTQRASTGGGDE